MTSESSAGSDLRVAMVAACPFPAPRGSQVLIQGLATALARRGVGVHVVSYGPGGGSTPVPGVELYPCLPPGADYRPLDPRKPFLDVRLLWRLVGLIRSAGIQLLHAHNYEAAALCLAARRFAAVPLVYHAHNVMSDELPRYAAGAWTRRAALGLGALLDRQIPRRADRCIVLLPEQRDFLLRQGVAAERICVLPPGIDAPAELETAAPAHRFVVAYAGNLDRYQDLEVLGEAIRRLGGVVDALLVLVTHERPTPARLGPVLAGLCAAGRARVEVVPDFAAVAGVLAGADVLVCPRASWSGFPIKIMNYMAAGRAIVAAAGSAKGLVDGETAVFYPNGDAGALAAALRDLAARPELRRRLGANARAAHARLPTWDECAERLERVYRVLDRSAGRNGRLRDGANRGLIAFGRGRISAGSRTISGGLRKRHVLGQSSESDADRLPAGHECLRADGP